MKVSHIFLSCFVLRVCQKKCDGRLWPNIETLHSYYIYIIYIYIIFILYLYYIIFILYFILYYGRCKILSCLWSEFKIWCWVRHQNFSGNSCRSLWGRSCIMYLNQSRRMLWLAALKEYLSHSVWNFQRALFWNGQGW